MRNASTFFLSLLTFILLFIGYFHPINAITQDLGRHLLTGEIITKTLSVPKTNLFSYTYPDFPFINHHYFSEVVFYATYNFSGFQGLLFLTLALIITAFGLLYFFTLKQTKQVIPLTIASVLYLRILFERTDIRPELFSFLFLSAFIVILFSYRKKFTKLIFFLIPLQFLWTQMHIYFIIGIFVIVLFFLDHLIAHRKKLFTRQTKIFFLVFIFCCLVTLLNPNGPEGALLPFSVLKEYGYTIEENQSIFLLESLGFFKPTILYFKIAVFLLFSSLIFSWRKTRPVDWLLAISFSIIGALAVRNFPLFVFATFLPFVRSFTLVTEKITKDLKPKTYKTLKIICLVSIICVFFWQIRTVVSLKGFGTTVPIGAAKAADFFLSQNLKRPVFNNFDIGSYLEYRLYPQNKVFVDGRPEAYPVSFFKETYIPMQENKETFSKVENQYHFNTIFFSHSDQTPWGQTFLQFIVKDPSWKFIYGDDYVVIFVKATKQNEMFKQISHLTQVDNSFEAKLRMANFYNLAGWKNEEITLYKEILKLRPTFCPALHNLTALLSEQNNPGATVYMGAYQGNCLKNKVF